MVLDVLGPATALLAGGALVLLIAVGCDSVRTRVHSIRERTTILASHSGGLQMRYLGLWILGVPVTGIIVMKLFGII